MDFLNSFSKSITARLLTSLTNIDLIKSQIQDFNASERKYFTTDSTLYGYLGKKHAIPDSLSRSPIDPPEETMFKEEEICLQQVLNVEEVEKDSVEDDLMITNIKEIAQKDNDYQELQQIIINGFPNSIEKLNSGIRPYWNIKK